MDHAFEVSGVMSEPAVPVHDGTAGQTLDAASRFKAFSLSHGGSGPTDLEECWYA